MQTNEFSSWLIHGLGDDWTGPLKEWHTSVDAMNGVGHESYGFGADQHRSQDDKWTSLAQGCDIGHTDAFCFWLIDGIGVNWRDGALAKFRYDIISKAISEHEDPKSQAKWTDSFCSLHGNSGLAYRTLWNNMPGIRRCCLVQPIEWNIPISDNDFAPLIPAPSVALHEFLPFFSDVISNPIDQSPDKSKLTGFKVRLVREKESEEKSPDRSVLEIEVEVENRVGFRIWMLSSAKPHEVVAELLAEKNKEWKVEKADSKAQYKILRDPYLLFTLDLPENSRSICNNQSIRYLYGELIGDTAERDPDDLSKHLPSELGYFGSFLGLEGFVIARRMQPDTKLSVDIGGPDHFWGGALWIGWLTCLYQRTATEHLASLAGNNVGNSSYLKYALVVETKWMYREAYKQAKFDKAYRIFWDIYDLNEIWDDVRDQSVLLEGERRKKQSDNQTAWGIFYGVLVLLAGVLGMNLESLTKIDFDSFLFLVILTCASFLMFLSFFFHYKFILRSENEGKWTKALRAKALSACWHWALIFFLLSLLIIAHCYDTYID